MHREEEYESFLEKLFIIGVYGSNEESPDFKRCLEKWFEGTFYKHHVLGLERHLYRQSIDDSIIDIEAVRTALYEFI